MDRFQEAREFCRILSEAGFATMMVGGCVRDRLLQLSPKDYDLATTAHPTQVQAIFLRRGFKVIPIGIEHGTVSVVTPQQQIEITTLRQDLNCDGRWAEIAFSEDFAQDARRRDFTINALFEDQHGKIHDFTGGLEDLAQKRLRFVGDARKRLAEDYLRLLRYFRFLARFGWAPEPQQLQAIQQSLPGLKKLSAERIHMEITRIFEGSHRSEVLVLMSRIGVFSTLFPWYRPEAVTGLAAVLAGFEGLDAAFSWFSLFHFGSDRQLLGKALDRQMQLLRFSRRERKAVGGLSAVFSQPDQLLESLKRCLTLVSANLVAAGELKTFLSCYAWEEGDPVQVALSRLVQGLICLPAPEIPHETLMSIAADKRGKAVELAKIFWYCGLSDSPEDLARIIISEQSSVLWLCSPNTFK